MKEINAERRKYANRIASKVAAILNGQSNPRCTRITRKRGWGYYDGDFSVPGWIFERHPTYRDYYIIHEAAHCITKRGDGDPAFHAAEQLALRKLHGVRIVYANHYPAKLVDIDTNTPLCGQFGIPI